jgi:hypothetical protein
MRLLHRIFRLRAISAQQSRPDFERLQGLPQIGGDPKEWTCISHQGSFAVLDAGTSSRTRSAGVFPLSARCGRSSSYSADVTGFYGSGESERESLCDRPDLLVQEK